jgi:LmbE family N-acetylglucosaminyl deacetylase
VPTDRLDPGEHIFHIATVDDWQAAQQTGRYEVSSLGRSLADEGLIHASRRHQVATVHAAFYADRGLALVLLEIDPDLLTSAMHLETPPDSDEAFPHIYGPLNVAAVIAARDMSEGPPRVLVVVAHPDDETFGVGSVIAGAVARGAQVVVCCATRGEAGASRLPADGRDLGDVREAEMREAGRVLGVSRHVLLPFADSGMEGDPVPGSLTAASLESVVTAVRAVVEDVRPHVVVTLDHERGDGHRDHVRIGEATLAALAGRPDVVVYLWCVPRPLLEQWFAHLARVRPDSAHLAAVPATMGRPPEDVTTTIDGSRHLDLRRRASEAHASQVPPFEAMPVELADAFLTTDHLVRVQPPWDGGAHEVELLLPPS